MTAASHSSLAGRTPLRVKLVAAVVALSALGLLAAGAAATTVLRRYLLDRVDSQLTGAFHDPGQLSALAAESTPRRRPGPQPLGLVYVQFAGAARPLPDGVPPPDLPRPDRPNRSPFTVAAQSGSTTWRVVEGDAVREDTGQTGVLAVAVPLDEVQRTVGRLRTIELVVGLAVLALLAAAGFLLVQRSLRPLTEVEKTAGAIAAGDLSLRVPESDPRTEVGRLSRAFNSMLAQIETAFRAREASEGAARVSEERMRRFVGDASHELRTPLASIRGYAELTRREREPVPPTVVHAIGRVESEAMRMSTLVEDLLLLARLDAGRPLDHVTVDLTEMVVNAVSDAHAASPDHVWQLDLPDEPVEVQGDPARLHQIVANLLGNARTHTAPGTVVRTSISPEPGQVRISVRDNGPGVPKDLQPNVFQRFARGDTSRNRAAGSTGLGLSIVAAVAQAHGGTVELDSQPGNTTFSVLLPA